MQGTIVFKKRELLLPEDFVEKILKARPDGLGYALHPFADKAPRILLERGAGRFNVKDVNDIQNAAHEDELIIWFMEAGKHHPEDEQPFTILGDESRDEGPDIVGFANGSFPNFIPSASDHSNEYFLFNKYLIPKLTRLGDNPNAIFNALEDDLVKMELTNLGGHIVLLSSSGRVIPFGAGIRDFEWGWTTDTHGYSEEVTPTVIEKTKKIVGQMLQKKDDRAAKPIASVEPIVQPPKTETAVPSSVNDATETFVPSSKNLSNNKLKEEYENFCLKMKGYKGLPNKEIWKNGRPWTLTKQLKDFKDLDKYASVVDKPLPIAGPKLIEAIQAEFKDRHSEKIPDPDYPVILRDMEKNPSFWDQFTNCPKNLTDGWAYEDFDSFCTKYPLGAARLAWSYRNELLAKDTQEYEVPDATGTGIVKEEPVEEPTPSPAPAPARKQPQMLKRKAS